MVQHCQENHKWKEIPCTFDNCNFVAYNSQSSIAHKVGFHSKHRTYTYKEFPCNWKNCESSFLFACQLEKHIRIHTNDLLQCVYCPYRTNERGDMKSHYRFHYKVLNMKCDLCEKSFINVKLLNRHYVNEHEGGVQQNCHLCKKEFGSRRKLQMHIRNVHKLLTRWNRKTNEIETYPEI